AHCRCGVRGHCRCKGPASRPLARFSVGSCHVSSQHLAASVPSTLPRQFPAPCRVSSQHLAASVPSTLPRQFPAPCRVSSQHLAASVPSTLPRQFPARRRVKSPSTLRRQLYQATRNPSCRFRPSSAVVMVPTVEFEMFVSGLPKLL